MRTAGIRDIRLVPLCAVSAVLILLGSEQVLAQSRYTFPMPNVIGLTVQQAEARVVSAGRGFGATSAKAQVVRKVGDHRPAGQIIDQLESPGSPMRPYMDDVGGIYGQVTFRVVVSTGPRRPTTFPMPNVVELTVPEAERRVLSAGREIGATGARAIVVERRSGDAPAGRIIRQLESPGTRMGRDTDEFGGNYGGVTFRVVVSTGPEPAPNFIGSHVNDAGQLARQRRVVLDIGPGQRNPRVSQGIVVRQDPAPGQPMPRRRVTVFPSAGYPLPNFVEQPVGRARDAARRLEFRLEEQGEDRVDVPAGVIFGQDPPAETLLPLRSPVRVRVSRGWPVPEFVGRRESEAERIAAETRIRLDWTRRDNPRVPAGIIFDQQPRAGERLPRDRTVRVTVSNGYPLPDLVGMHQDEARRWASELDFGLDPRREPLVNRPVDHIDRQNPAAGARLPLDGPVSIVVSAGWPTPEFLELEEEAAAALAAERQVTLQVVDRRRTREIRPGIVIDQNPPPGALLPPAQAVGVVVSGGEPTPRLIGLTEDEAGVVAGRRAVELIATRAPRREFAPGRVAEQSPEPDAPLPADGRVSVVISTGWPTPDFVGRTEEEANGIAAGLDITLVQSAPREDFGLSAGRVSEQEPRAEDVLPPDRRVRISLSLGWPVAPEAVGRPAGDVRRDFLARHPNAIVDQSESLLTLEPTGTVISQQPGPNVKLGRQQRLELVVSAVKPPWAWPAIGVVSITLALGVFAGLKAALGPSAQQSVRTENPGGVRLRVTKDHGVQTAVTGAEGDADRAEAGDIVRIRVNVDLGEQSAGPLEDTGDES